MRPYSIDPLRRLRTYRHCAELLVWAALSALWEGPCYQRETTEGLKIGSTAPRRIRGITTLRMSWRYSYGNTDRRLGSMEG